MAQTAFSTSNALTKKAWEEKLFRDWPKDSYFGQRFMGKDSNSLIHVTDKVEKSKGDKVTFGIRMRLSGSGVTGATVLEGNEEDLTTYDYSVSLEQYRHAVRDNGALTRKRAMFDISAEAQLAIKDWGAEKIDQLCFDAIYDSPSKVFYKLSTGVTSNASAATAKAALTAADSKITPSMISALRVWALTGGNYSQTPVRPIKVDGGEYLVLLVHPDVMYDLKQDSTFNQARQYAQDRGKDNPLFKNAIAIWDDVVIHENLKVGIGTDAGAGGNVPFAKCALMGAQALCWAWGERPKVVKKTFDYDNQEGFAFGFIAKAGKPQFNSKDYACLNVYFSRTNVSGL